LLQRFSKQISEQAGQTCWFAGNTRQRFPTFQETYFEKHFSAFFSSLRK